MCFVRDEHTYGEFSTLCAVLVLHQDAVLAGISRVHLGDCKTGKLARLELEDVVVVRHHLPLVLQPGDLWNGVARDVAGQVEGLCTQKRHRKREQSNRYTVHKQKYNLTVKLPFHSLSHTHTQIHTHTHTDTLTHTLTHSKHTHTHTLTYTFPHCLMEYSTYSTQCTIGDNLQDALSMKSF